MGTIVKVVEVIAQSDKSFDDAAQNAVTASTSRRDALSEALRLLREGARPERISAARGDVGTARASLAAAVQTASMTRMERMRVPPA